MAVGVLAVVARHGDGGVAGPAMLAVLEVVGCSGAQLAVGAAKFLVMWELLEPHRWRCLLITPTYLISSQI